MRPMRGKAGRVRLKVPVITGRRGQSGRGLRALQARAELLRFRASRSVLECAQSSAAFCFEHTKLTDNSSHTPKPNEYVELSLSTKHVRTITLRCDASNPGHTGSSPARVSRMRYWQALR